MDSSLNPKDLRAFVGRRWDLVEKEKLRYVADRYKKGGPAAARLAAQRLFQRWRTLHPEVIDTETRSDDLAAHVALKSQLDQAGDAIRGR
jgi:hypothetical protein